MSFYDKAVAHASIGLRLALHASRQRFPHCRYPAMEYRAITWPLSPGDRQTSWRDEDPFPREQLYKGGALVSYQLPHAWTIAHHP